MSEQTANYNETDAVKFIHENISAELKKKFSKDDISYILDLVYEYYEILEEGDQKNETLDMPEMLAFVNESLKESDKKPLEEDELEELLEADNGYMDSIGLEEDEDEDENDENIINLDELVEDVYKALPAELQKKFSVEDVYLLLCFEADYLNENDLVDEDVLRSYIINSAEEEELEVDLESLNTILKVEAELLGEEE